LLGKVEIKDAVTHLLGKVEIKEIKLKKDVKIERNGISTVIYRKIKPELNKIGFLTDVMCV
jgi:hypothetical protein